MEGRVREGLRVVGGVITKHYRGDDSDVKVLLGGMFKRSRA